MSRLPFPRDVCHGDGKRHSEALTGPVSGVWLMSGQSWHCPRRDAVGQTSPGHCPAKWELGTGFPRWKVLWRNSWAAFYASFPSQPLSTALLIPWARFNQSRKGMG